MKCPKCGNVVSQENNLNDEYSFECNKCGYSAVAMFTEKIDEDENMYEIIINDEIVTNEKIKALAKIANINCVNAKRMFLQKQVISKDVARVTLNVKNALEKASISFVICPDFNW